MSGTAERPAEVLLRRLPEGADLPPPARATPGSAGFDLHARVDGELELGPGRRFRFEYDYCKGCGVCAAECPCGAIEMVPEEI